MDKNLKYLINQGISKNLLVPRKRQLDPQYSDLIRLYKLVRTLKPFTILEFGVGYSTLVMGHALLKNKQEWECCQNKPTIRNRFLFKIFSVDSSRYWIKRFQDNVPSHLKKIVNVKYSQVRIGTYNGQICHFYSNLPDIIADFIYLDGPDPRDVKGKINGLSFNCAERTVMSGDLLLMESTFLPGTFIIIDGRTNNARFLKNNFKRKYDYEHDYAGDYSTFHLTEDRLGKYNILGTDVIK